MSQQVLSITQVNEYIRSLLDQDSLLCGIAVKGEISNYKVYPSGHHYFTLKDEEAALKCVMFRGNAVRLRFHLENGMKIIAMGRISVYPRDGAYQLYCSAVALDGIGDLHTAFEQLKAKLAAQGLFDPAHKKQLPQFPSRIGIITSPAGAAIHDILRILRKRYPLTNVRLFPVRVQGAEAPAEIASAIQYANRHKLADLLIVGRGGGSIEDLWAFNDEGVAYAIFQSEIPIISAVGHEPDVTISDYVADLRAATPSNAAELAVQDADSLKQAMDAMMATMQTTVTKQLRAVRRYLDALAASPSLQSPRKYIMQRREGLYSTKLRLIAAQQRNLNQKHQQFIGLTAKLDAMSPLKVLSRGYAMALDANGEVLKSIAQVNYGDKASVFFADGAIDVTINAVKEGPYERAE